MVQEDPLLVTLVKLVDRLPFPETVRQSGRGRPRVYSDWLMIKALVIIIVRRLYTAVKERDAFCTSAVIDPFTVRGEGRFEAQTS